jgi:hypothetical protein
MGVVRIFAPDFRVGSAPLQEMHSIGRSRQKSIRTFAIDCFDTRMNTFGGMTPHKTDAAPEGGKYESKST